MIEKSLKKTYSYRDIWVMAFPILISLLMEQVIGVTDTAFLGRVGEVELGASAIASIFYVIFFMIAFGFSIGAQILIARRNGEGRYSRIGNLLFQALYFQLALALVLFLVCQLLAPYLLRLIISSEDVFSKSVVYLRWRTLGFFFSFTAVTFRSFYIGIAHTRILTINSLVMVIVNVLFDYILIFGKFGFPNMGIAGAALASAIANFSSFLFFLLYTYYSMDIVKYGLDKIEKVNAVVMKKILSLSFWTMLQNTISFSVWFLFFIFIEHLGERPLAIANIVRNISGLLFMIVVAFGSTAASLVSNQIGAGNKDGVATTTLQCVKFAYAIVIPVVLLIYLMPDAILSVYTNISELREDALSSLYVMASSLIITTPGFIFFEAVSGTGNTKTAMAIEVASVSVYAAYIVYMIDICRYDVAIDWTAEHVYYSMLLVFSLYYIRSGKWRVKTI